MEPAEELARAGVVGCPGAEAGVLVIGGQVEGDDLVTDLFPAGRLAAGDVAHDLGIAVEAHQVVLVRDGEPAECEASGLQVDMHLTMVGPPSLLSSSQTHDRQAAAPPT